MSLATFREETRAWLAEHCPPAVRGAGDVPWGSSKLPIADADARLWLERMVERGWTVPSWPREFGGAGLSRDEYQVLREEMARINARPPLTGRGINYIGPTILEFGTEAQKAKWLPRLARGDGGWCMGYSEPNAGSDLASLQMRCVDAGNCYRVNGMKTWTSDGLYGDWIFCLVRTDPAAAKHEGISLVLVDMNQPGVTVRPIRLISGASPFCETFFDDAVVAKDDLIGPVNGGWAVGKRLLQYERSVHGGVNTSGTGQEGGAAADLVAVAREQVGVGADGRLADAMLRQRLLRHRMEAAAYRLTQRRVAAETEAKAPALATSILKVSGADITQERTALHQHLLGVRGSGWEGGGFSAQELAVNQDYLFSRAVSIYGGTREIHFNIIAKRVLGLPD